MTDLARIGALAVEVMLPLSLLVAAGGLWPRWFPDTPVEWLRNQLSRLTMYLFYPAILFSVAMVTPISRELLAVPLVTALAAGVGGLCAWALLYRTRFGARLPRRTRAVLVIGAMFGNTFNIGVPVLLFLHGEGALRYAVFNDMLMVMPLVWSLGVWICTRLGVDRADDAPAAHPAPRPNVFTVMMSMPPIWAFIAGATLQQTGLVHEPVVNAARMIGQPTIPVMLFVLGLTIPWHALTPRREVLAATAIKLLVVPVVAWALGPLFFEAPGDAQYSAAVLAAVPGMLTLLMLADRFDLDAPAAALFIGWSTIVFWLTLPVLLGLGIVR
ncbi:MAG: AEC family transporter [Burkholderiales bacterium]|nr:AEC family transporter [Burkholderiales bacterium]